MQKRKIKYSTAININTAFEQKMYPNDVHLPGRLMGTINFDRD
jgi:hypothetical protein